jgi:hypothetical protein
MNTFDLSTFRVARKGDDIKKGKTSRIYAVVLLKDRIRRKEKNCQT